MSAPESSRRERRWAVRLDRRRRAGGNRCYPFSLLPQARWLATASGESNTSPGRASPLPIPICLIGVPPIRKCHCWLMPPSCMSTPLPSPMPTRRSKGRPEYPSRELQIHDIQAAAGGERHRSGYVELGIGHPSGQHGISGDREDLPAVRGHLLDDGPEDLVEQLANQFRPCLLPLGDLVGDAGEVGEVDEPGHHVPLLGQGPTVRRRPSSQPIDQLSRDETPENGRTCRHGAGGGRRPRTGENLATAW